MVVVASSAALALAGCSSLGPVAGAKPLIVTGVSQWASLAREVAGPDATVVSLLADPNADPHEHEATVGDAAWVARATIVIENGDGYDSWLTTLVSARPHAPVVIDAARLASAAPGSNPHLFYKVAVATRVVRAVAAALASTAGAAGANARASQVLARLGAVAATLRVMRASCHGVGVAATEDVAGYLLADAGLRVETPRRFRLAVGNGVDPSVGDLAVALDQLHLRPAFIVDNVQTATPLTEELVRQARQLHVPVVKVTETMTRADYGQWISGVIAQMRRDLRLEGCLA